MQNQKSQITTPHGGEWFSRELKFLGLFLTSIICFNLIFSNKTFALFTPTLSASIDNTTASVNGNQVINSTNKTTEIPLNLTVNTNNRTGYTATLNSETDETALVNNDSINGAKINSISSISALSSFSNNSWGYKFGSSTNYAPIPALSTPAQIIQTTGKTNGNESNQLSIGMKLTDNLESGNYQNELVLSFVSNPYQMRAMMTEGADFNIKLKALETAANKIEHFKKSAATPTSSMNVIMNIEDEDSDYGIKLWLDPTDKTAYYYAETEKVYLNMDSSRMFHSGYSEQKIKNTLEIDLSGFDTSQVTHMNHMFSGMSNLTTINLSNFDTAKVTDMSAMFYGMSSLTTLNLSNFDTSQVIYMESMFYGVRNLTTLNLSNFDTSKVTNMRTMFYDMRNLTTLNISSFDTSQVTDMNNMFAYIYNLTTLDLSSFDTSQVKYMDSMFSLLDKDKLMDKLEKIYVNNDFNTTKLINSYRMFENRKKLRGGNGSYLANPTTADKTWLRVDRPGVQGYFTRKP